MPSTLSEMGGGDSGDHPHPTPAPTPTWRRLAAGRQKSCDKCETKNRQRMKRHEACGTRDEKRTPHVYKTICRLYV